MCVININSDKHHELLEKCRVLKEIQPLCGDGAKVSERESAVDKSHKRMHRKRHSGGLSIKNSNEVINMLMAEYDYETDIEVQREKAMEKGDDSDLADGERIGRESGFADGRKIERNLLKQVLLLRHSGKTHEETAAQCDIPLEEVKDMLDGLE